MGGRAVRAGLLGALGILLCGAAPPPEWSPTGMVASDHALASAAGAEVLAAGGNAVDAAVATALAAGVVQPAGSGLGGGGFAVVQRPGGQALVLDFREVAPAAADRELFVRAAAAGDEDASRTGGLAVAVPAEGPGLAALHARWGRLPLSRVTAPALRLAARGFPLGPHLAAALDRLGDRAGPLSALLFGTSSGPPGRGQVVRRRALAGALRAFAASRGEVMRRGWVAADMVAATRAAGGILTEADLAADTVRERAPLVGRYREWTVTTMPPPSSGGAVLLQALAVLEGYDLPALGAGSSALWHLLAEVGQHAFADRARLMGDPDRVQVPLERILSPDRVAEVRAAVDPDRTQASADAYGLPVDPGQDGGTQHISVIDADGLSVALTTTVNTSFGSEVVAPRSGILLNDQMDDFVARPGVPNAFGLVGSEANAVAPGARPLSSMTPTVLSHPDGRRIVIGASGGPTIISATLQAVVSIVDFGLDPAEAVSAPRMHHQWQPRVLSVDEGTPEDVVQGLRARGHQVRQVAAFSAVQVVLRQADGSLLGASDPRKGGAPAGVPRDGAGAPGR